MNDFWKQLEHTRPYAAAFWQHEMIDRPYVNIRAPRTPDAPANPWCPAGCFTAAKTGEYDKYLDQLINYVEHTCYGGEEVPNFDLSIGPDQFAAFFGGRVCITGSETWTTWVNPFVEELEGYVPQVDRSEGGDLAMIKRWLAHAGKRAEGHFLIDMLDLHGGMDCLSPMRSPVELCYDVMDCPEDVIRCLDLIEPAYREFYEMAYELGNMGKYGTVGWQPVFCEGRAAALQCDFSCMLSPEQGRKFVFPYIRQEAELLDHCMYHLDGKDALCHLDTVLDIDAVDFVQWVPGAGQPRTMEWMDVLHKIQKAGKGVWIYDWTVEEIKQFHKELEPDKVVYSVQAETPQEVDDLLEYLVKNT